MQMVNDLIGVGEWVIIAGGRFHRWVGYITKYDFEDDRYYVRLTIDSAGVVVNTGIWFDTDRLLTFEASLEKDDLLALIDLALDMNDKEWFLELSSQLENESN